MCRYKSLIVTRTEVLSSENSESHEDIIRKYELNDKISPPDFIRVEMIPTGDMADPQDWEYHLDQDTLPKWYDARAAETACRQEIKKMLRRGMKIEGSLEDCPGLTSLPNGIKIEGSLEDCPGLTSLPEGIKIGGSLGNCPGLTSLPEGIKIGRDLRGCSGLTSLPEGIEIGGNLWGCPGLISLPEGSKIGGSIRNCPGLGVGDKCVSLPEARRRLCASSRR